MLLLRLYHSLFLILWLFDDLNGQLHLYYSSDGSKKLGYDYDCLDLYANDRFSNYNNELQYPRGHQIIPFCRRDNIDDDLIVPGNDIPIFTFEELNQRNVSSVDLYAWSVEPAGSGSGNFEFTESQSGSGKILLIGSEAKTTFGSNNNLFRISFYY